MGIKRLIFISIICSLAVPDYSVAPTITGIQSSIEQTIQDQDNQNEPKVEDKSSLINPDPLNVQTFAEKENSIEPSSHGLPNLPSRSRNEMDRTINDIQSQGLTPSQNSILPTLKELGRAILLIVDEKLNQNKSLEYDYDADDASRGNGWNEERPSVESDEIWRKYYTGNELYDKGLGVSSISTNSTKNISLIMISKRIDQNDHIK